VNTAEPAGWKSFTTWQRLLRVGLGLFFLYWYFGDIRLFLGGLPMLAQGAFLSLPLEWWLSLTRLLVAAIAVYALFLLWLFWFAQFVLPVTTLSQRWKAFVRLFVFSLPFGLHGPAVFIRDGEIIGDQEEIKKKGLPGVAFVDLRSAIALEKQPYSLVAEEHQTPNPAPATYMTWNARAPRKSLRSAGPGLVFIDRDERISGVVDIRKQVRTRVGVFADTRDGIRIKTNVFAVFSLNAPPDVLDVCLGQDGRSALVIEWDTPAEDGSRAIKNLSDELHPADQAEIRMFINSTPNPASAPGDIPPAGQPYSFDPERILQAVYGQTQVHDAQTKSTVAKAWHEWPTDVGTETFRILLSQYPYNDLYLPDDPLKYPMLDFKRLLAREMRNKGVLAYRAVRRVDWGALRSGETYAPKDLAFYEPRKLNRSDVLRDRGIKVFTCGFTEMHPVSEEVRKQLVDSWLAAKEKEIAIKKSEQETDRSRIINQERARAHGSIIAQLAKILESEEYSDEALAMVVYQELESAAANPEIRRLLPRDTLRMLSNLREWLTAEESDQDELEDDEDTSDYEGDPVQ
jgi:hypothetical protein